TGIDISTFYIDKPGSSDTDLAVLIEAVNNIEGIERIRLGSLEVGLVTEAFIGRVSACSAFCPHFHLSLQSGSDGTLKRMNRHYTADEFYETVQIIRKAFPDAGITTDIIAGFPGETEEEFEETKAFVNKVKFTQAHIFPYSRRKGTKADKMPGQLTKAVKEQRTGILINEASAIQKEHLNDCIGKTVSVLAEEIIDRDGESFAAGYTPEYIRVVFNGEEEFVNSIVTVNVTAVSDKFPDTLYGCINA
ncbi:MAG: radical SAM protein, partial [Parasporobacterium sp.]|nr:radical SAM protein [Parasporobacterium sp.]